MRQSDCSGDDIEKTKIIEAFVKEMSRSDAFNLKALAEDLEKFPPEAFEFLVGDKPTLFSNALERLDAQSNKEESESGDE